MKVIIVVTIQGWSCFKQQIGLYDHSTSLPTWKTLGICFSIIQAPQLKAAGAQAMCMCIGLLAFQLGSFQLLLQNSNSMGLPF